MDKLEKLEKKVEEKVKVDLKEYASTDKVIETDNVNYLKLNAQIDAIYRLINNTTRRIERSLLDIKNRQDVIMKLLESEGVDVEELQKQEEIKALENKLMELKGGLDGARK